LPVDAAVPGPMTPVAYRVAGRRAESADTATLAVEPVTAPLARPRPGQFHMLWAFGVGEVPISVSHVGEDGTSQHHTVRAVGATTRALCSLGEGDTLGVRGPFGTGWDLASARGADVVVVAGGLGLAPLRPVVEEIVDQRDQFDRVAVLVGARSPDDLLFADVVAGWRGRFDLDVAITVDHARGPWHGDVGVVTSVIPRMPIDFAAASAFVCGPEIMMRFAGSALRDAGVAPDRIQVSLERNMVCGVAHCGHCQLGPTLLCREGPVYALDAIGPLLTARSL
jgi:anaerobic sulfite reductase subunit B